MKKKKIEAFFESYYFQLVVVVFIIISLMLMAIVLMKDINKGNEILETYDFIKSIYLSVILGVTSYSYSQGSRGFKFQLFFGKTRKEIYYETLKNVIRVVFVCTFLAFVYIFIDRYFSNVDTSVLIIFKEEGLLFMLFLALLFSLIGFLLGLLKMNSRFAFVFEMIVIIGLFILLGIFHGSRLVNLILVLMILSLIGVNYLLVEKVKIKW